MARCASPGPDGHRCASTLSHPGPYHQEGDGHWPLYAQERTALAIVDRLALTGDDRVRTYAATLEQLNREDEARNPAGDDVALVLDRAELGRIDAALRRTPGAPVNMLSTGLRRHRIDTGNMLATILEELADNAAGMVADLHRAQEKVRDLRAERIAARRYLGESIARQLGAAAEPATAQERIRAAAAEWEAGLPRSGKHLAELIEQESRRLGYASVSDYLNAPGQDLSRLEQQARELASLEASRDACASAAQAAVDRGDSTGEAYWTRRLSDVDGQIHQARTVDA